MKRSMLSICAGCALLAVLSFDASAKSCALKGQKAALTAQLFFGRDIKGRSPLTDQEWEDFEADTISKQLPEGFTVFDGQGEWLNPQTKAIVHEKTKILLVTAPSSPALQKKLSAIIEAYKGRFNQQSVLLITTPGCAKF
jgi:hypothetical protein